MTEHYNRITEKNKRKELRNNAILSERKLWHCLKNKQMRGYKFRRQYSIDNYIIDFYCPELRLAIEIDGISHLNKEQYDKNREKHIKNYVINIIRINGLDILNNITDVLYFINNKIDELIPPLKSTP
jgi:very-short-patch-repair endonuclease